MTDSIKVGMISLGCDKNRVDSERMLYSLSRGGYELVQDAADADVMIINTCAFIDKAKKEAIETILETAELKKGKLKKLVVSGCFAQRYGTEADMPEVDRFVDIRDEKDITAIIDGLMKRSHECNAFDGRILTTPSHYAYLKIADGCNNRCSYCAIPAIRGNYVSEPMEELIKEASRLASEGVKELILVAQDTTNYGVDIYRERRLIPLLKELCKLNFWKVRLLYTYPELITDELIAYIQNEPKMAKYLDIPMQHISSRLLKKMNRKSDKESILQLIDRIKTIGKDIAVRSSFIVGFPTETEEEDEELNEFVKDGLNYAGFFAFSPEEGTLAFDYKPKVPRRLADKWIKKLEITQCLSTVNHNKKYLNTVQDVIYEGINYDKQTFEGRNEFNAPDIDTKVFFTAKKCLSVGNVYKVRITEADFNLIGEVIE